MRKLMRERDILTGRFLKSNTAALRHGGFASNNKNIPLRVRRQVQAIREQLVRDIGGAEPALTAAQAILIDKTINLYQITLCLEAYVRREGPFRGKKLDPVLGQNYLAYVNTIRLNLRELGITTRAGENLLGPLEIAAEIDAKKAQEAREAAMIDAEKAQTGQSRPRKAVSTVFPAGTEAGEGVGQGKGEA